jgi:predicted AAA+ superfamily ATPase
MGYLYILPAGNMANRYSPRIVDAELDELLRHVAAVAIEGPKGVGKTATAERRVNTTFRLDDPAQRELAAADPVGLLAARPPILIDEWQHVPAVWDAVRRAVDRDATPNRFLLAGSASPMVAPTHSGAGRVVTVRMRPLALSERDLGRPTVSVRDLLKGGRPPIAGHTDVTLADYAREIVTSGFPGIRHLTGRALRAQLDGYLARIVQRDFLDQGHRVRKPETLRRWMAAYAAATATTTALDKIRGAATGGDGETPARNTVTAYREVLEQLWVADPVPGWLPSRNRLARLSQAPKHHLADSALAARLLGIDEGALLSGSAGGPTLPRDGTLFGRLFESMMTQSVRAYAQAAEASVRHLREKDGRHEIDLIVERADQRVLAIETKLSASVDDDDVKHLRWLKEQLGDEVLDTVIVTTGTQAYRRADGVAVVPGVLLGE